MDDDEEKKAHQLTLHFMWCTKTENEKKTRKIPRELKDWEGKIQCWLKSKLLFKVQIRVFNGIDF